MAKSNRRNKKMKSLKAQGGAVIRNDGFMNTVTGIGTSKDKRVYNVPLYIKRTEEFYEQFFTSNEIARRIVESVPTHALRKSWEFMGDFKDHADEMMVACEKMSVARAVEEAWIQARTYGGSILYAVSKTGHPSEPLDENEEIVALVPLSRFDLRSFSSDIDSDFQSKNYSRPELYFLNLQMGTQYKGYPIHWSRCVRFDGDYLPRRTYVRNNYWHDSILNKLYNSIRNYESANDAVATTLQDFNLGVYKMKNLADLIAGGQEDVVQKRIQMLEFAKSSINAMILDSEDEDYVDLTRSISGIGDALRSQSNRLVAATDLPHTILLGESPDGSNSTGNSTTQAWNAYVASERENYLKPKLNRLFKMIFKQDVTFKFPPLTELTDSEQTELMNKQAQTDALYIQNAVLDPEEIAESRFAGDKYSIETNLDKEARDAGEIPEDTNKDYGASVEHSKRETDKDIKKDSLHEHNNYSRIHVTPNEVEGEYVHNNPGSRGQSLASGDDNPQPASSTNSKTETKVNKREPLVSISQSTPFTDPNLEDITWLKSTETKEYTPEAIATEHKRRGIGGEYPHKEINEKNSVGTTGKYDNEGMKKYPQAVTVQILNTDGKLLMGRRNDTNKITTPGGMMEEGEKPREAAARELWEETGIKVAPESLELVRSHLTGKNKGMIVHHYKIDEYDNPTVNLGANDPDREVSIWNWLTPDEIENSLHHMQHADSVILDHLGYYENQGNFPKEGYHRDPANNDAMESVFLPRQLENSDSGFHESGPQTGKKSKYFITAPE